MVSNAVSGTISDTAILHVTEGTAAPQLTAMGSSNGQFAFRILGDPGRLYRIQSSTNLVNWFEESSFPKKFIYYDTSSFRQRNGVVYNHQDILSIPRSSQQSCYRTTDYVPPLARCINNLAVIRFAKEIWSLENNQLGGFGNTYTVPSHSNIALYMKNGGPSCPVGGPFGTFDSTYIINRLSANPFCTISLNHILEEPEY